MYVQLTQLQLFEGRFFQVGYLSLAVRVIGHTVLIVESGRGAVVKSVFIVERNRI